MPKSSKKPKLNSIRKELIRNDHIKQIKKIHIKTKKASASKEGFEFTSEDSVLVVGDGNFSFSRSLADQFQGSFNLTATCFDSMETLNEKYPDAATHIEQLKDWDSNVVFGVDATKMSTKVLKNKRFTKIIFNFPHVGLGIKDQYINIQKNQQLISQFLEACPEKLSSVSLNDPQNGQVFITIKSGLPYDLWDIKKLAKNAGFKCVKSFRFDPTVFSEYRHRRTIGFKECVSVSDNSEIQNSRTYAFIHSHHHSQ